MNYVEATQTPEFLKTQKIFRRLLIIAGLVYGFWWVGVELLLPQSFNPPISRLAIVAICFICWGLSFVYFKVQTNIQKLFAFCTALITMHYYYLFYYNLGDINWVIGAFITVTAVGFGMLSIRAITWYSVLVLVMSGAMLALMPHLTHSVFFPGILTILIQANVGLRSRLGTIKTLADSNERFRLLFNSTFEGVLVHENGIITNVNEALIRMTGFKHNQLIGMSVFELLHPDDRALAKNHMKEIEVAPYEARSIRKDGAIIDIELRAKEFHYQGHTARLANVMDITDRKRAEKNRIAAMAMAENVRSRDEFISIASHELKTPISALKLQTQLIERNIRKNPDQSFSSQQLNDFISLFNRQVNRLTELVETMLNVSHISSGQMTLNMHKVNLTELAKEVISLFSPQFQSKSTVSLEAAENIEVWADQSRIRQVIENLLTNAIKYGDGKPVVIKLQTEGSHAVLTVEDHGLGIAPEFIDRIFDRFERAISARNISGFGLGLYIVKQIVEAHQGTITVKSHLGSGSVFKVVLPLKI